MASTITNKILMRTIKCDEVCPPPKQCYDENLYIATVILGVLTAVFILFTLLFYCLYMKEKNLRITLWNVKTEDLRLDKMQWNPSEAPKQFQLEVIDEKTQMGNRRYKPHYTVTGSYKGRLVAVQKYRTRRMSLEKRSLMSDLDQVFMINHEHICKFYGANQAGGYINVLTEYCTRGSLEDLLRNQSDWDDVFKNSLIFDIVKGMLYLHQTPIDSHGNLKPSNCLIDSRFMVKITDFGIIGQRFKIKQNRSHDPAQKKLWTAPELLRAVSPPQEGSKKGDVYSFAIIAQEILYQRGVFYRTDGCYTPDEILQKVMSEEEEKEVFRPTLCDEDGLIIQEQWRKTLKKCWAEKPKDRLDFQEIFQMSIGLQTENTLLDSLLQRLQLYSNKLEKKVEEKTEQYKAEKEKSDFLLYQMLPKTVANDLRVKKNVMPESYNQVTVFFSDIVGFSEICHKSQPMQVVQMLNDLYTMFDRIIDEFDVYKVETIGDAYMVVSGLPIRNGDNHAREIARMAIRLRDHVSNDFQIRHMPDVMLKLRVGIHTGPVVAGVVGKKMPRYCLFGDTVNTAARMEQSGKELKIHVSPKTKEILDGFGIFNLKKRKRIVTLKGIGEWHTWWLTGEKNPKYFEIQSTDSELDVLSYASFERDSNSSSSSSSSSNGSSRSSLTESIILSDASTGFVSSTGYNSDPMSENEGVKPKAEPSENKITNSTLKTTCDLNSKTISPQAVTREMKKFGAESKLTYKCLIDKNGDTRLKTTSNTFTAIGAIF